MPQSADSGVCVHHWRIETPSGPTSTGVCKRCKAQREFANSERHSAWTQQGNLAGKRGRATQSQLRETKTAAQAVAAFYPEADDDDEEPF